MNEFKDKVAVITGAASGIGHAIAKRFVEAGGRVAIADLNMEGAVAAAKELGDEKTAIGVAMDVANEEQVNAGVEGTVKTFGTVDILVSNAGIQIVHPIEDFPFAAQITDDEDTVDDVAALASELRERLTGTELDKPSGEATTWSGKANPSAISSQASRSGGGVRGVRFRARPRNDAI